MAMQLGSGGGSSGRRRRGRRAPVSEINVTPLVDVMLVLLIIFMITAPMLSSGVPINLPESAASSLPTADEPIEISVDSGGAIFIGDTPVTQDELSLAIATLADERGDGAPPAVNLRGDTSLQYGLMMRIMGELNAAGIQQIGLVTVGSSTGN